MKVYTWTKDPFSPPYGSMIISEGNSAAVGWKIGSIYKVAHLVNEWEVVAHFRGHFILVPIEKETDNEN